MTLAEQFMRELELHDSQGKLGIQLFHETILKFKGTRSEIGFKFEDESQAYYDSYNSQWILSEE